MQQTERSAYILVRQGDRLARAGMRNAGKALILLAADMFPADDQHLISLQSAKQEASDIAAIKKIYGFPHTQNTNEDLSVIHDDA